MTFFRESFPQATVPIKMHLLEDHGQNLSMLDLAYLANKGLSPFMLSSHDIAYHTLQLLIKYSISYV